MERREPQTPQGETTRILVEFLEVAVNSIVFLKGVYPSGAFERRRYMNIVAHKARHPQLKEYIHSTVMALQPFIQKGVVETVAVVFFDNDNIPIEKFVFNLKVNQMYGQRVEETDLMFSLRSFLMKLSASEPLTKGLPLGCRWEITSHFRTLPEPNNTTKEADIWIPTDTQQWQQPPLITPIKSMSSEPVSLQLYVQHSNFSEPTPSTSKS